MSLFALRFRLIFDLAHFLLVLKRLVSTVRFCPSAPFLSSLYSCTDAVSKSGGIHLIHCEKDIVMNGERGMSERLPRGSSSGFGWGFLFLQRPDIRQYGSTILFGQTSFP